MHTALQLMCPSLQMWLDVEQIKDTENLEEAVRESDALLIFLSKGYLASPFCRQELGAAWKEKKPLVLVRESRNSDQGGVSSFDDLISPSELERVALGDFYDDDIKDAMEAHLPQIIKHLTCIDLTDTTPPPCRSTFAGRPLMNSQAIRIAILRTSCGGIVTGLSSAPSCGKWWSWSTILAILISTGLRMSNVGRPRQSTRVATMNLYCRTVRSCAVRASQRNLASGRRGKRTRRIRKGQADRHSCL